MRNLNQRGILKVQTELVIYELYEILTTCGNPFAFELNQTKEAGTISIVYKDGKEEEIRYSDFHQENEKSSVTWNYVVLRIAGYIGRVASEEAKNGNIEKAETYFNIAKKVKNSVEGSHYFYQLGSNLNILEKKYRGQSYANNLVKYLHITNLDDSDYIKDEEEMELSPNEKLSNLIEGPVAKYLSKALQSIYKDHLEEVIAFLVSRKDEKGNLYLHSKIWCNRPQSQIISLTEEQLKDLFENTLSKQENKAAYLEELFSNMDGICICHFLTNVEGFLKEQLIQTCDIQNYEETIGKDCDILQNVMNYKEAYLFKDWNEYYETVLTTILEIANYLKVPDYEKQYQEFETFLSKEIVEIEKEQYMK